jgi:hypothetical protein
MLIGKSDGIRRAMVAETISALMVPLQNLFRRMGMGYNGRWVTMLHALGLGAVGMKAESE